MSAQPSTPHGTNLQSLHWQLCDALVGWENFTGQKFLTNLIGHDTATTFSSKAEVYDHFLHLYDAFMGEGDTKTASRINNYLTYFDHVYFGREYTLSEYFGRMTGLALEPFSDEVMAGVKDDLMKQLARVNVRFENASTDLLRTEANHPVSVFLDKMNKILSEGKSEIARLTGLDADFGFSLVPEESTDGKAGACEWKSGQCRLLFNTQSRSQCRLDASADTIWHEWAHGKQTSLIAARVLAGELPRSMGVTSTIGSDVVQAEGIADSIFQLLPLQTGRQLAWRQLGRYSSMVIYNALVMQDRQGLRAAGPYLERMAPYILADRRVAILRDGRENFAGSYYALAYGPVNHAFNGLAKAMGREGYGAFLGKIIPQWMDVGELNAAIKATGHGQFCLPVARP